MDANSALDSATSRVSWECEMMTRSCPLITIVRWSVLRDWRCDLGHLLLLWYCFHGWESRYQEHCLVWWKSVCKFYPFPANLHTKYPKSQHFVRLEEQRREINLANDRKSILCRVQFLSESTKQKMVNTLDLSRRGLPNGWGTGCWVWSRTGSDPHNWIGQ